MSRKTSFKASSSPLKNRTTTACGSFAPAHRCRTSTKQRVWLRFGASIWRKIPRPRYAACSSTGS